MSRSLRFTCAIFLGLCAPAFADKSHCYRSEDYPDWTVTVFDRDENSDPEAPEMIWHQGDKDVRLISISGGTGIPRRALTDLDNLDNVWGFVFVDDALVLDYDIYRPGCK